MSSLQIGHASFVLGASSDIDTPSWSRDILELRSGSCSVLDTCEVDAWEPKVVVLSEGDSRLDLR